MIPYILIVDDEPNIRKSLKGLLEDTGYKVETAPTGEEALLLVKKKDFDIILLDIVLPGINGIEVLKQIREIKPEVQIVMISGQAVIEDAVNATKLGAYDFIEKPIMSKKLLLTIKHIIEHETLKRKIASHYTIIGESSVIKKLREQIKVAGSSNARVLIQGESGTGKELVARAIHRESSRKSQPFIPVNCAAIPRELIESELFGYEKGAFTGAITKKEGKFILANNGTIFLDEIGDMGLETQAKLLRVLEENEIEPVGSKSPIKVNVRVVSATNKNLEKEISKGNFREDLFFRINTIPIYVPPLRERIEDIEILSKHFLELFCKENGKKLKYITKEAIKELQKYEWPGNIRELKNFMERLAIMIPKEMITREDVIAFLPIKSQTIKSKNLREQVNEFEKSLIKDALIKTNWNITKSALLLKTDRANLYRKIREYKLTKD